jgi:hypothetical protein
MDTDEDDRAYFLNKRPDKTYVSRSFPSGSMQSLRIACKVIDGEDGLRFANVEGEQVLRTTHKGRVEIKATFLEDDRRIKRLLIQKYDASRGPNEHQHFTFTGPEIDTLLSFVAGVRAMSLEESGKIHLTSDQLADLILNEAGARRLFADHEELFVRVAESEELQRDLVAVGYRRKQLERFEHLLADADFFQAERDRLGLKPEAVWQAFFEANTWIFGYGLTFHFLTSLDDQKLEQVVRGFDVTGHGKRVDALMKTQARINSLCFVEVKRHDSALLASSYRPGAWPPSADLSGGVAQVQATVQDAVERIGRKLEVIDREGNPSGEALFNIEPRSFLIVGNLDEFVTPNGINEGKFRSFELYRRNMRRPEVITYDELLHRARFIVDHGEETPELVAEAKEHTFSNDLDDDVPF